MTREQIYADTDCYHEPGDWKRFVIERTDYDKDGEHYYTVLGYFNSYNIADKVMDWLAEIPLEDRPHIELWYKGESVRDGCVSKIAWINGHLHNKN